MTHDPRDRVQVLRGGQHVAWARKAATIVVASHDGRVTVRGTREALAAAGVDVEHGDCTWVDAVVDVDVEISPVSLAPRPSGSRVPEAERTRPTVQALLRLSPDALARLDAAAERAGLSRSAYVEKLAGELPPAIVQG